MEENQRIRLSKKMLKESLIRLLNEKSIHKISVREICDGAQINRTTFYKYYGSPYDLLGDMENDVLTQVNCHLSDDSEFVNNNLQRLIKTIAFIGDNIDLCRILLNNNVDPEFPEKLIQLPSIQYLVKKQITVKFSEDELAYIFGFMINGGFSVIKRWINKEIRETPEEISAMLYNTIMKLFPESTSS